MNELHKRFLQLWDEREDENGWVTCFETGKGMHRSSYREVSACYSHILPKKEWPQFKYEAWNIKIVTPEAHDQYTKKPRLAKKQYQLYLKYIDDQKRDIQENKVAS